MTDTTTEVEQTTETEPTIESNSEIAENPPEGVRQAHTLSGDGTEKVDDEPETFPREYVEKLRREAADARVKAKERDDLARRLHTALVAQDGRLVAPDELAFDEAHLADPEALNEAITALVERKPYLAARRLRGDIGQGERRGTEDVDLAGILRARA